MSPPPQLLMHTHIFCVVCFAMHKALCLLCIGKKPSLLCFTRNWMEIRKIYNEIDVHTPWNKRHLLIGFTIFLPQCIGSHCQFNWKCNADRQYSHPNTHTLLNAYQFCVVSHFSCLPASAASVDQASLLSSTRPFNISHLAWVSERVNENEQRTPRCRCHISDISFALSGVCVCVLYLCAFRLVHQQFSSICVNILLHRLHQPRSEMRFIRLIHSALCFTRSPSLSLSRTHLSRLLNLFIPIQYAIHIGVCWLKMVFLQQHAKSIPFIISVFGFHSCISFCVCQSVVSRYSTQPNTNCLHCHKFL